jgi:hypothetical protein
VSTDYSIKYDKRELRPEHSKLVQRRRIWGKTSVLSPSTLVLFAWNGIGRVSELRAAHRKKLPGITRMGDDAPLSPALASSRVGNRSRE